MKLQLTAVPDRLRSILAVTAFSLAIPGACSTVAAQEAEALRPAEGNAAEPNDARPTDSRPDAFSAERSGQALIIVGLPGDEEHAERFARIERQWIEWLTGPLGFAPRQVTVLSGKTVEQAGAAGSGKESGGDVLDGNAAAVARSTDQSDAETPNRGPATRASLEETVKRLSGTLQGEDRLWVLLLGHGNHDGRRAFFHLPGPDVSDRDLGLLLADVECAEQVFWLTNSCSGWMVQRLSKPGRIVIAATEADLEVNETEFPGALATVSRQSDRSLDQNADGRVSVLEVFAAAVKEVAATFEADQLAPTEHAQLDDNGDRKGTELPELEQPELGRPRDENPQADAATDPRAPGAGADQNDEAGAANSPAAPQEAVSGTGDAALPPPVGSSDAPPAGPRRPEDGERAARTFLWQAKPPTDEQPPPNAEREDQK